MTLVNKLNSRIFQLLILLGLLSFVIVSCGKKDESALSDSTIAANKATASLSKQRISHLCISPDRPMKLRKKDSLTTLNMGLSFGDRFKAVFVMPNYWYGRHTLNVYFMDGSQYERDKVMHYANVWSQYCKMAFVLSDLDHSDIRVSFAEPDVSWSYIGTDANNYKAKVTMNFGWFDDDRTPDYEYSRTVEHEFGHALGLAHEQATPAPGIVWDTQAVYKFYGGYPNYWDHDMTDFNVLARYSSTDPIKHSPLDTTSIMLYPIPPGLTKTGFVVGWNDSLSEIDKSFIHEIYY